MRKILDNPTLLVASIMAATMVLFAGARYLDQKGAQLAVAEALPDVTADIWRVPDGLVDLGVGQKSERFVTEGSKEVTTTNEPSDQREEQAPRRERLPKATDFELHPVMIV